MVQFLKHNKFNRNSFILNKSPNIPQVVYMVRFFKIVQEYRMKKKWAIFKNLASILLKGKKIKKNKIKPTTSQNLP